MNKLRIAINGFGRIGRLAARHLLKDPQIELVAINDQVETKILAHLFQYDSSQGKFDGTLVLGDHSIQFDGKEVLIFSERNPKNMSWGDLDIDVVLECTGVFREKEQASMHLEAGAKKVLLSAPSRTTGVPTLVYKINENQINANTQIYSNASCTTNCLAPLVKVVLDNWGFEHAFMSTVHAYTNNQNLQDAPHTDLRRARAAAINMIPTTTGAGKALELVMPEVKGKIEASAIRVPVVSGSLVELMVQLDQVVDVATVNAAFQTAAEGDLTEILTYSEAPLVSSDIVGNTASAIFDAPLTSVKGNLLKITAWYDNEAGYAARLADIVKLL